MANITIIIFGGGFKNMFLRNLEVFYAYICMESLMTINNQYFEIVAFIYVYLIYLNEWNKT